MTLLKKSDALAICFLSMAAVLVFSLLPFLSGVMAKEFNLPEKDIGLIALCYFSPYAVVTLFAPLWISALSWSRLKALGLSLMMGGVITLTISTTFMVACLGLVVIAFGAGIIFPLVTMAAADMPDTDRIFALKLATEQLIPAGLLIFFVIALEANVTLMMLGLSLLSLIVIIWWFANALPDGQKRKPVAEQNCSSPIFASTLISLIALSINFAGFAGLWAFLERIGNLQGFSTEFTTTWLSVGLVTGGVGSLLGAASSGKIARQKVILLSTSLATVTVLFLTGELTKLLYALSLSTFPMFYMASIGFLMSSIAEADTTQRLLTLIPFSLAVGAALGPVIFAELASQQNIASITMAAMIAVGALAILFCERKHRV
jgi:predicted MFS family arabinose efflux permease